MIHMPQNMENFPNPQNNIHESSLASKVDIENKKISSMVPTDWERTKIVEKTQEHLWF